MLPGEGAASTLPPPVVAAQPPANTNAGNTIQVMVRKAMPSFYFLAVGLAVGCFFCDATSPSSFASPLSWYGASELTLLTL